MLRLGFGAPLAPLHSPNPFAADHVGPGAGHGDLALSSVKIDQHFALGGLAARLVIEVDQLLIVALHEINLDALDPPLLKLVERLIKFIVEATSRPPTG